MQNYVLQPNDKNIYDSLLSDMMGRNDDVISLAVFLNSLDQTTTIALDGDWGSGKTFFVKQTKLILDSLFRIDNRQLTDYEQKVKDQFESDVAIKVGDGKELINQISIYYDAWEHDDENDPLLSLIYRICVELSELYQSVEYKPEIMKAASKIVEAKTGINIYTLVKDLANKTDWLEIAKAEALLKERINDFFDTIYIEKGDRMVLFIDELDRCNPKFAVELLERIKHYFNSDRITFVFSVNLAQLKHTIQKYYGDGFDGYSYLDRIFDYTFSLPEPNKSILYKNLGLPGTFRGVLDQLIKSLIEYFNMSIREAAHFTSMVNTALLKLTIPQSTAYSICGLLLLPLAYALKTKDIDKYKAFVNGRDDTVFLDFYESYPFPLERNLIFLNEYYEGEETSFNPEQLKSMRIVKKEDKLLNIYDYVFSARDDEDNTELEVGPITIERYIRDAIKADLYHIV